MNLHVEWHELSGKLKVWDTDQFTCVADAENWLKAGGITAYEIEYVNAASMPARIVRLGERMMPWEYTLNLDMFPE